MVGIRLEFEAQVSVGMRQGGQRLGRTHDAGDRRPRVRSPASWGRCSASTFLYASRIVLASPAALAAALPHAAPRASACPHVPSFRTRACAAVVPERIAPSIVEGRPVAVQSPARTRFAWAVTAPGRRAASAGVAAKVARFSLTICQLGSSGASPVKVTISAQIRRPKSSRGTSSSRICSTDRHG